MTSNLLFLIQISISTKYPKKKNIELYYTYVHHNTRLSHFFLILRKKKKKNNRKKNQQLPSLIPA